MRYADRIAIVGATGGLGVELAKVFTSRGPQLLISRSDSLMNDMEFAADSCRHACDLSQQQGQARALEELSAFEPSRIICTVGGGPYGPYGSKQWKDHRWAFEVSFLFQARLVHYWLTGAIPSCRQMALIGSAVAENSPDPLASSYSAAKHALRGLVYSVSAENPRHDLRLYSPGYMDTKMLPPNSLPRKAGARLWAPSEVALDILQWLEQPHSEKTFHRLCSTYPGD